MTFWWRSGKKEKKNLLFFIYTTQSIIILYKDYIVDKFILLYNINNIIGQLVECNLHTKIIINLYNVWLLPFVFLVIIFLVYKLCGNDWIRNWYVILSEIEYGKRIWIY